MKCLELTTAYTGGAVIYGAMELCFRGHTHWSMLLTGGACFLSFHLLFRNRPQVSQTVRCLAACGIITAFELAVGWLVNLKLNWNVWDYSNHLWNLRGQICLLFSCFWFLMGIPMSAASRWLCRGMRRLQQKRLSQ